MSENSGLRQVKGWSWRGSCFAEPTRKRLRDAEVASPIPSIKRCICDETLSCLQPIKHERKSKRPTRAQTNSLRGSFQA